jgi:2-polyprenyl-3-methyl-5-hydroxy-6-metoxy-1,4-benzoquinol methylase
MNWNLSSRKIFYILLSKLKRARALLLHLQPQKILYCSERSIEKPFIFENLLKLRRGRVLDVGCAESTLITELASLGFEAHGIDARLYPVKYSNVTFIEASICEAPYKDNSFDVEIAVSTIEHIGMTVGYWGVQVDSKGDEKAIREITRMLKPDGKVLITLPYGVLGISDWYLRTSQSKFRVYNGCSLKKLLEKLSIETANYYALKGKFWVPVSEKEAERSKRAIVLVSCKHGG